MKTFVCKICNFVSFDEIPEICPVCSALKKEFSEDPNAIKQPINPQNLNDSEKKHIPVIKIERNCSLLGSNCTDILAKIGALIHPMEEGKHWIIYIDFYLDKKVVSRQYFRRPNVLNPGSMLHLKAGKGIVTVLGNCNLHGRWINEINL